MSRTYDLIVIGAGVAGTAAATQCAAQGWRVAIVDSLPYGGTCPLRGCDPKKILRRGAEIIDSAHLMRGKGIDDSGLAINWADLMAHKHGFTDPIPRGTEDGLIDSGVTTLHGRAQFVDAHQLEVDGTTHTADRFLIATGAQPRPLDFPGHEHLIDSTEFLDLDALPARILFVGGGFISFEFAHIAARVGSEAVIIDHGARPLKGFDPDLVELVVERGRSAGVEVRRTTAIVSVERSDSGLRVTVDHDGTTETIETDLVVHGAGRIAQLEDLRLDVAGVEWGDRGVSVADHLQSTTNPAFWAIGDAADTAGMPLTPVSSLESEIAAANMLGDATTTPDYSGIPTAVFTIPELARVGMLEADARENGIDLDVRYSDTSGWYSNYRVGETTAAAKILVDRSTDLIVGAHLLGPGYGEVINTFGMAIKFGLTASQLATAIPAYPTTGSDLASML
ncbi:dihydrolipoyl dehydrogenase family protein [Dietzia alimentaria]|uniref:dihydrolipoyl dehydrogenase family protein n=1 Tax=Dietzia alimentaria TaxID=665550 RepID=UPI000299FF76|nr:NAD(P)/FAD-dependent oxidoreductase [Dietzia alimentaria]